MKPCTVRPCIALSQQILCQDEDRCQGECGPADRKEGDTLPSPPEVDPIHQIFLNSIILHLLTLRTVPRKAATMGDIRLRNTLQ